MRKQVIVISDLHMGTGHGPGHENPYESFAEDERFTELLDHHMSGKGPMELVLGGDFYDFLQVPIDGRFSLRVTAEQAVRKVNACMDGHPQVHAALQRFLEADDRTIVVLPGNHDWDWVFDEVQAAFRARIGNGPDDARIRVITHEPWYSFDGVEVHHGQQFELMHRHNFKEPVVRHRKGPPTLNLPWGSHFIVKVLTRLKRDRPYLDKLRPFKLYLMRALIFDPVFFLKVVFWSVYYFLKTRLFTFRDFGARMRQNWMLITEFEVYPDLFKQVRHRLKERAHVHTVILGHTHVPLVRHLEDGRTYINSGGWTETVSLDLGTFAQRSQPTYVLITYPEGGGPPHAELREWSGKRSLFRTLLR
ncbi:MAG: metallophosphoesterase family protein [Planctomycetota bacterium]